MLTRLWRLFVPRPEPAFDWSRLPAVLDLAASACPLPLVARLTADEAAGFPALLAAMLPGDELWRFHSPDEAWQAKAGRSGVALVRGGAVVRSVITMLN